MAPVSTEKGEAMVTRKGDTILCPWNGFSECVYEKCPFYQAYKAGTYYKESYQYCDRVNKRKDDE